MLRTVRETPHKPWRRYVIDDISPREAQRIMERERAVAAPDNLQPPALPRQPARARRELTSTFEIERPKRRVLRPEDVKKSDGHHILQVMIAIALR